MSSVQSVASVLDNDLTPQVMTAAEPSPVPTKRPSVEVEPTHWGQSSPAPADAPNTVRRLQLWTCCKPDPTETTEEHVNSKLTHEPTDEPTPRPTVPVDSDFCGHGLNGCFYYSNECEPYCECDWERGFETCADCNLGEATVCIRCLSGYTLSGGECHANGAFTNDEEKLNEETGVSDDFWMGIGIGFVIFSVMAICAGMMVFLWKRNKAVVIVPDHEDGIQLTEDQQLEAVDNTRIELNKSNESVIIHETKPMEMDE